MARPNVPQWIVVHHTGKNTNRDTTTYDSVNRYHQRKWNFRSKFGSYLAYHYFIDGEGRITHARDNLEAGAHTKQQGVNYKSIGVCLTGNFDHETPSQKQTSQLQELLFQLHEAYGIPPDRVVPHRTFAPKSCYGTQLADDWAQNLLLDRINESNNDGRRRIIQESVELLSGIEKSVDALKENISKLL